MVHERCRETVDYRSDLFSLRSVLYTACTGRPAFRSEPAYRILRRITDDDPRPVREINSDIPKWLCRIINRLMAKRPADRFQNAAEVSELLESCLAYLQQPNHVPLPKSIASSPLVGSQEEMKVSQRGSDEGGWRTVWLFDRALLMVVSLLLLALLGLTILNTKSGNRADETASEDPGGGSQMIESPVAQITSQQDVVEQPSGRPQGVQSPIEGRVVRWNEDIVENARVRKG